MSAHQLMTEIVRVDQEIATNGKGRLTVLKAYQRKLYAQYRRAVAA